MVLIFAASLGFFNQGNQSVSSTTSSLKQTTGLSVDQTRQQLKRMGLVPIYNPEIQSIVKDPWKVDLYQRLDRIRIVCGILCRLNTQQDLKNHVVAVPDSVIPMIKATPVNCAAMLASPDIDASDHTTPPIPPELLPFFTFNLTIPVTDHPLRKTIYLGTSKEALIWTEERINSWVRQAADGTLPGTYGIQSTVWFRDDVSPLPIRGKSILVIGSETPWVEAIMLHFGAAKVTTLEYAEIVSEHAAVKTLQPYQFREQFIAGTLEQFDGVVTHSSLEHSGLGRYGDALNPWGDILAVARAWCVTKPGGFLYLGLPTGTDNIMSNWHRTYGLTRWPLVAANWRPMPSTSDGSELLREENSAWDNGGFGYKFTKA